MSVIWFDKTLSIEKISVLKDYTMGHHLGFEWVELGPDFLKMRMPVDNRTKQPFGILHGGASCVLAETLGSLGAFFTLDGSKETAVGLDINANHIRSVRDGFVTGTAKPIHIGRTTQVWEILIHDEAEKLVCVSRITMAILKRQD